MTEKYSKNIKLWNSGYCKYVQHYGDDLMPLRSARMSTLNPTGVDKKKDDNLRDFLWRKGHCYHPDMEVLTTSGFKKWSDVELYDEYLVPDPKNNTLSKEILKLETFDYDGAMYCYKNQRMEYKVTENHRMWFKSKAKKEYEIYRVEDMPNWGHFQPLKDYENLPEKSDKFFELVGFYLGDGFRCNNVTIGFNLKKERKIKYLKGLLLDLRINFNISLRKDGASKITFRSPEHFNSYAGFEKAADKKLLIDVSELKTEQIYGLFLGLLNSDGSIDSIDGSYYFMTRSDDLNKLFEVCSTSLGMESHKVALDKDKHTYKIRTIKKDARTSLECRAQYKTKENYTGKTYCTTTSTGLLIVRGGDNVNAFVCGNTSVFEQVGVTLEVQVPIFIARQFMRHKLHFNEFSQRYSEPMFEYYIPDHDDVCYDNEFNKQMSGMPVEIDIAEDYINDLKSESILKQAKYEKWRKKGIAKERVRDSQPVNSMTRIMATGNLRDWLFFLNKRLKPDAQKEIRELSEAIFTILKDLFPLCCETFEENTLHAESLSRTELLILREWNKLSRHMEDPNEEVFDSFCINRGLNKSRIREFKAKIGFFDE